MKHFHFTPQRDSMDCGPTCLHLVAKYYGKHFPVQLLRERSQIGKEGVNMLGISEAAESIGFRTRAVRLSYETLISRAQLPCILFWRQTHFVVLYKVGRRLHVADPAAGLLRYTKSEFFRRWVSAFDKTADCGIALLLETTPKFYSIAGHAPKKSRLKNERVAFKNIFNYIIPYKKLVVQLMICLLIGSIIQLVLPFLTRSIVDVGVNTANIHFIYAVFLAQIALFFGRLTSDIIRSWILLHISSRINISILTDFLIKLMKLPVAFFDSKRTGDLLQRMNDHQRIETFITGSSINVIFSVLNLLIFSFVLGSFNSSVFLVFILSTLLYSIWVTVFLNRRRLLDYKRFEVASREQGATIQIVQAMQEIKLNGLEKQLRWGWEKLQFSLFRLNMKNLVLNQWQQSGASFINEGKNILIVFVSAKAVIDGQMTLGAMLAVQYIIGQLNSPIEQMIGFVQSWQNAKISMDRLNEIHGMDDEEPADRNFLTELPAGLTRQLAGGRDSAPETPAQDIIFSNVSFKYPGAGNEPVLKDINLRIPKGKTTAIVGVSGSGKTSLLKLLLKFYDPQQGEIRLSDVSLQDISHKAWRSQCGVVMQESYIFSDTVAYNIVIGDDAADMGKVKDATERANGLDFIESLPLGFDTKIGPEGVGISMGQRQRILIARAIYRNPDYIFFDEATNSLDANNESIILKNLESFFRGKTVVVVAHRLSTVKNADQIVVLDKGVIAERGVHADLVSMKGKYYTLVKNQLELGQQ
jgi:ATP-binding cassette, subfamily B, bacterial